MLRDDDFASLVALVGADQCADEARRRVPSTLSLLRAVIDVVADDRAARALVAQLLRDYGEATNATMLMLMLLLMSARLRRFEERRRQCAVDIELDGQRRQHATKVERCARRHHIARLVVVGVCVERQNGAVVERLVGGGRRSGGDGRDSRNNTRCIQLAKRRLNDVLCVEQVDFLVVTVVVVAASFVAFALLLEPGQQLYVTFGNGARKLSERVSIDGVRAIKCLSLDASGRASGSSKRAACVANFRLGGFGCVLFQRFSP